MSVNITVEGKVYTLKQSHLDAIEKNKIDRPYLRMRIRGGWSLDLAASIPKGVKKAEIESYLKEQKLKVKSKKHKANIAKPKPWLSKYPQRQVRGEFCKHLWEYDIFPKRQIGV